MMLRFAIAQINPIVGDLEGNTQKICRYIRQARAGGADVVVFPELAITGYPPKDLLLKPDFVERNLSCLEEVKKVSTGICVITGFVARRGEDLFNAAAVICDGRLLGISCKYHLPNYDVFDEKRYFTPSEEASVFNIKGAVIGVNLCEDVWFEDVCQKQCSQGAELIVNLSASPFNIGKMQERLRVLKKRVLENRASLLYVNLVGGQDDLVFDGGSLALNPEGVLEFTAPRFEEGLFFHTPGEQSSTHPAMSEIEEVYQALLLGLHDYVVKNGFSKVVLGLSGGIDSAVSAVLCTDAMGSENVIGVSMPSHITSAESRMDARRLAENLGIGFKEIPIASIYREYLLVLEEELKGLEENVAEENLQARIRGNLLMALSNKFGYLVVTTGNKSELAVGYATLYGDMAGGFAVISDVPKTMVYRLAEYINERAGFERIPETIIRKEPSAELRVGQRDTDSLPPYSLLDAVLGAYIEENKSVEEITSMGYDPELVQDIIWRVDHNEYKRKQAPPGIKITTKAFGTGRRMPITNRYRYTPR